MQTLSLNLRRIVVALFFASFPFTLAVAGEVEVLHWWTSGGEAKAIGDLKKMMTDLGDMWKDYPVAGGKGDNAMTALKTRVVSGHPPTAAQIKGPQIQEWGHEGVLANIDSVAQANHWDSVLLPVIANTMKYQGHYVAAPITMHRMNWLWVNPQVFKQANAQIPTNLDEFFIAADKLKAAGIIPLAHGGQPWQDATLFETIALAVGGVDFYKQAFVQRNPATLTGPVMIKVFETMQRIKPYIDKGAVGRDWNLATAMVIQGKAGMQFMGDFAKGEFTAAGKQPGRDYLCVVAPSTQGAFTYNVDSLAMFIQKNPESQKAQMHLAQSVMDPKFQETFNLIKGSIPVRTDISLSHFDECAQKSFSDMKESAQTHAFIPSFAHTMAMPAAVEGAVTEMISNFMHSNMTAEYAVKQLALAAKTQ